MSFFPTCLRRIGIALLVDGAWLPAVRWTGHEVVPADGMQVTISTNDREGTLCVRRSNGDSLRPEKIRLELEVALLNYAGVIVPDCGRHYVNADKAGDMRAPLHEVSACNAGHPFIALADEAGRFLFAFGLLNAPGAVQLRRIRPVISTRRALVGGDEPMIGCWEWVPAATSEDEVAIKIFASGESATWFHALRNYTRAIQQHEEIEYPMHPNAWNPTWCTWTAFGSHDLTSQRVMDNARIARDLGISSIILDDGWFGPGLDDDIDAPMNDQGAGRLNIGDYRPDPHKLPDLAGLVRQIQAMGLKVLLWHAPLCVARTSDVYADLRRFLIRQNGEEFVSVNGMAQLCPACPEVRERVAQETTRLFRDFGIDGLKVDLYNCLPAGKCQSTEHRHDIADPVQAVDACMQMQWRQATTIKPDALFELKQDYGNVRLARHGTMVRAGDTAYDVATNCRRCFYVQAYAPVVHNDYLITGPATTPKAMALLMVRMLMAGVPNFGNDLTTLNPELLDVVKAWLEFYNERRALFSQSREPQDNFLAAWQGGTAEEAWVAGYAQCRELSLPEAKTIWMLNGTGRDAFCLALDRPRSVCVERFDHTLRSLGTRQEQLVDGCRLVVPEAGLAVLM